MTHTWDNRFRLWSLDYEDVARRLFHIESFERFKQFMKEIFRVLRWDRATVIVLGRVRVRGRMIDTTGEVAGVIADSMQKSDKHLWYLREEDGVSKEVILELHKGDYEARRIRIDWSKAKLLTVIKEELEVDER